MGFFTLADLYLIPLFLMITVPTVLVAEVAAEFILEALVYVGFLAKIGEEDETKTI